MKPQIFTQRKYMYEDWKLLTCVSFGKLKSKKEIYQIIKKNILTEDCLGYIKFYIRI